MPADQSSDVPVNTSSVTGSDPGDDEFMVERPEDDDHDLLTFGEAGARLVEEVARQESEVEALRGDGAASPDEIAAAESRLSALREAQERNREPSLDEMRQSGFFGDPA